MIEPHDTTSPALESWLEVAPDSDFPIQNLPLGVFVRERETTGRIGTAIGDRIVDLRAVAESGLLDGACDRRLLERQRLNALFARGRDTLRALRRRLSMLLRRDGDPALRLANADFFFVPRDGTRMLLPVEVGDYVDFYSSLEHATNLGRLFRPDAEPLLPNWRWMPIGYHGRSATIVVDGTPIVRPSGQRKPKDAPAPVFGPSAMLDIELEMGFVVGRGNALGAPIPVGAALEHIAGFVLVNDWSARDMQAWEYQPLGPFLGKSFATTISPWVVTLDALEPFRVTSPVQQPPPLPYLHGDEPVRLRHSADGRTAKCTHARCGHCGTGDFAYELPRHVLECGAATRPRDRQRGAHARRRPLRFRHDLGSDARQLWQPDRTDVARRTSHRTTRR